MVGRPSSRLVGEIPGPRAQTPPAPLLATTGAGEREEGGDVGSLEEAVSARGGGGRAARGRRWDLDRGREGREGRNLGLG
jgi:hypothetical protein